MGINREIENKVSKWNKVLVNDLRSTVQNSCIGFNINVDEIICISIYEI